MTKEEISAQYQIIQDEICEGLELLDTSGKFQEEIWERDGGGGGRTRIMQEGKIIEKGGVNFSSVYGKLPEAIKTAFKVSSVDFFATGISIVIHPSHPFVPIIHMNIRYFEMNESLRWFGGGIDLTPHYVYEEDAQYFHQNIKAVCDRFNKTFYAEFKTWADNYFFIKHRNETRGIGGIFYDRLNPDKAGINWLSIFEFSKAIGRSFVPIYTEIVNRHRDQLYTESQKNWQYIRRGRYAEFNLVYDAGTKFGLETNGRIESILMSLPPQANWIYNVQPEAGSDEARTLSLLKKDINWII
ncbi:oxygen-dependent coproporphyrinogen oxidase [Arcticibacter eurypsychrophilus]|uniref:oxygen-dependent coproporphyrinogen oxidase n=1 Tax=Arcticibacter eurypsychrophilus TaxID=1434752 RepID=UPI00084D5616|nr:oxygen-dependent coproporphyrinogen oxidase [Arcticibacter eurypsychrophilus]